MGSRSAVVETLASVLSDPFRDEMNLLLQADQP